MKTITEMIQQFKFFSTFNDIPAIITLLELIESDSEGKQATIESLRIELRKSEESCLEMTGYEMSIGELSLNKVIHDALLTLAAYSPLMMLMRIRYVRWILFLIKLLIRKIWSQHPQDICLI